MARATPKAAPAKKTVTKAIKKVPIAAPKKVDKKAPATKPVKGGKQLLEIGLLLDCTSSMGSWIERAKTTLTQIVQNVVDSADGNLQVRVCFVGYRDHCDTERFTIHEFTDDIAKLKTFISTVKAIGGGDFPEDVVGGQRKCLD